MKVVKLKSIKDEQVKIINLFASIIVMSIEDNLKSKNQKTASW